MPKAWASSITTSTDFCPSSFWRSSSLVGADQVDHGAVREPSRSAITGAALLPGRFGAAWPWRSLSDRLPIPLADRGEHVEHQATGGASGVDLLADGEQRGLARCEVAFRPQQNLS